MLANYLLALLFASNYLCIRYLLTPGVLKLSSEGGILLLPFDALIPESKILYVTREVNGKLISVRITEPEFTDLTVEEGIQQLLITDSPIPGFKDFVISYQGRKPIPALNDFTYCVNGMVDNAWTSLREALSVIPEFASMSRDWIVISSGHVILERKANGQSHVFVKPGSDTRYGERKLRISKNANGNLDVPRQRFIHLCGFMVPEDLNITTLESALSILTLPASGLSATLSDSKFSPPQFNPRVLATIQHVVCPPTRNGEELMITTKAIFETSNGYLFAPKDHCATINRFRINYPGVPIYVILLQNDIPFAFRMSPSCHPLTTIKGIRDMIITNAIDGFEELNLEFEATVDLHDGGFLRATILKRFSDLPEAEIIAKSDFHAIFTEESRNIDLYYGASVAMISGGKRFNVRPKIQRDDYIRSEVKTYRLHGIYAALPGTMAAHRLIQSMAISELQGANYPTDMANLIGAYLVGRDGPLGPVVDSIHVIGYMKKQLFPSRPSPSSGPAVSTSTSKSTSSSSSSSLASSSSASSRPVSSPGATSSSSAPGASSSSSAPGASAPGASSSRSPWDELD